MLERVNWMGRNYLSYCI